MNMQPQDEQSRVALVPVDPPDPAWGPRVGPYVLGPQAGYGPVGTTYRAQTPDAGEQVAAKVIHSQIADDPGTAEAVLREARAAQRIDHPHVARVLHVAPAGTHPAYVCCEWVEGTSASEALRQGPRTTRRIVEIICQVLSGLAEGHRRGVVHGHVCPSNVLVGQGPHGPEHVWLCDFGLASALPSEAQDLGGYAAPEQRAGERVDGRADVYGAGILLFELWTGRRPEAGATLDFTNLRPPMPAALAEAGAKAVAPDRDRRFASPLAMVRALRQTSELLGPRLDLPIDTGDAASPQIDPEAAADQRVTMPGDQLRSSTKLWLGIALVAFACGALAVYAGIR